MNINVNFEFSEERVETLRHAAELLEVIAEEFDDAFCDSSTALASRDFNEFARNLWDVIEYFKMVILL